MSFGFYANNSGAVMTTESLSPGYVLSTYTISSTKLTTAQLNAGQGFVTASLPNTADFTRYAIFLRLQSYVNASRVQNFVSGFNYTANTSYSLVEGTYSYRFNYLDTFNTSDTLYATLQVIGY
jgi:hypothetical protein